jgi:hypothetical protein
MAQYLQYPAPEGILFFGQAPHRPSARRLGQAAQLSTDQALKK